LNDMNIPQQIPTGQSLLMFNKAFQHGWLHSVWAKLTGQCFCLIDLDEAMKSSPVESSHYAGIKAIHIGRIHGTQGKADEFDAEFNPIQERSRCRWMGVALEKLRGHDLPPVNLIEVNGIYYVRDGHHRISVSHALGQDFIDAEVTVLNLRQHHMSW
jgi:hypothetical protein